MKKILAALMMCGSVSSLQATHWRIKIVQQGHPEQQRVLQVGQSHTGEWHGQDWVVFRPQENGVGVTINNYYKFLDDNVVPCYDFVGYNNDISIEVEKEC